MIKEKLKQAVEKALAGARQSGRLPQLSASDTAVVIEQPKLANHGDLATGVALKLASAARMPPLKIAEAIAQNLELDSRSIAQVEVAAPGFINFHLGSGWLAETLLEIHRQGDAYGRVNLGQGASVLIEYVSANPTGDLHIGHGRGAVYGSCLANLLAFAGYEVAQEFYINDAGEQMSKLGECAWAAYQRLAGREFPYPDDGYPEDSLKPYVAQVNGSYLSLPEEEGRAKLAELTGSAVLSSHRRLLERLRVRFDRWFSEKELYAAGKVERVLKVLSKTGMSYEQEGAVWLKARELGDERDRVLMKSGGQPTYLAADAAYHLDKYERGYRWLINVWGADHYGQIPGLKAVMDALGKDSRSLEIILTQIVNLAAGGKTVRMSKRMGTVVTLEEVMDEVGVDATRYYLAESNPQNPINFDLELAKKTSSENPAFYIQYAHARCSAILKRAQAPVVDTQTGQEQAARVSGQEWQSYLRLYRSQASTFQPAFVEDRLLFIHQKALVMRLSELPEEIEEAVRTRTPGRLARYAYEIAVHLQKFYETCRVITQDDEVTRGRLGLIVAVKQVLKTALDLIGVSAPERM